MARTKPSAKNSSAKGREDSSAEFAEVGGRLLGLGQVWSFRIVPSTPPLLSSRKRNGHDPRFLYGNFSHWI